MKKIIVLLVLCFVLTGCFKTPPEAFDVQAAIKKSMSNYVDNSETLLFEAVKKYVLVSKDAVDFKFQRSLDKFEKDAASIKEYRAWETDERKTLENKYNEIEAEAKRILTDYAKSKKDYENVQEFMIAMDRYLKRKVISKEDFATAADLIIEKLSK